MHLADAVGVLLRQHTMRIHYLPGRPEVYYTARAPGLLVQLAEAVGSSSSGTGGRTVPGSRLPLNADVLQLWTDIQLSIHGWAKALGVSRREPDIARLLRQTAAAAVKPGAEGIAATMARRCACGRDIAPADCSGCWAHRIEGMLTPTLEDREIRGAACSQCTTEHRTTNPENGTLTVEHLPTRTLLQVRDGELYRVPAIVVRVAVLPLGDGVVATADDLWIYRMCRACGAEGWLDFTSESVITPEGEPRRAA